MTPGRWRTALAGTAALAGLVRAVHVVSILRSPMGEALVQDARVYDELARRLLGLAPAVASDPTPFNNLGYPYLLAAVYALAGPRPGAVMALQAVLGAAAVVLLGIAVRDLLDDAAAGLLAALAYALAQTAVFYDGLLLTPAVANLALVAALAALGRGSVTGRRRYFALAGAALGAAILVRTNLVLAIPFFALAAAVRGGVPNPLPRRRRWGAACLLAVCAAALPVSIVAVDAARTGDVVPLTANGGMNFWIGNAPRSQGVYYVADFLGDRGATAEQEAYLGEARRRTSNPRLTLSGASRYWFGRGLEAIAASPGRWLALEGRKVALFWSAIETKTNLSLATVAALSPVLRWTPVRFALLAVLGAAGLVLIAMRGNRRAAAALGGLVAAAFATCVVFFVSGEYRHAALPALCAGGAALVLAVARGIRRGAWGTIGPWWGGAAAAAAALALASLPWPGIRRAMPPEMDAGDLVRAICSGRPGPGDFARARALLAAVPTTEEGRVFRADTRGWLAWREAMEPRGSDRAAEAFDAAREVLALDYRTLLGGYEEGFLRSVRQAAVERVRSLATQPWVAADPALSERAALLGADGFREVREALGRADPDAARAILARVLALTPDRVEALALEGEALYASGDRAEAIRAWGLSCDGWPRIPDCAADVAAMYAHEGNTAQARVALEEALRRDPSYGPALRLRSELR